MSPALPATAAPGAGKAAAARSLTRAPPLAQTAPDDHGAKGWGSQELPEDSATGDAAGTPPDPEIVRSGVHHRLAGAADGEEHTESCEIGPVRQGSSESNG